MKSEKALIKIGFFLFLIILSASVTWGHVFGHDGNGGDGVIIKDKIYLFDLYESGVKEPNLSLEFVPTEREQEIVNSVFSQFHKDVREIVAHKIAAIRSVDFILSEALLFAFKKYSWRIIPHELNEINDEDGTDITYPIDDLIQVAVRSRASIKMTEKYLDKMDSAHVAALIFHEVMFAFVKPTLLKGRVLERELVKVDGTVKRIYSDREYYKQSSRVVREIVSFLFSESFSRTPLTLRSVINGALPVIASGQERDPSKLLFAFHEKGFVFNPMVFLSERFSTEKIAIDVITWKNKSIDKDKIVSLCQGTSSATLDYRVTRVNIVFEEINASEGNQNLYLRDYYFFDTDPYWSTIGKNSYQMKNVRQGREYDCVKVVLKKLDKYFKSFGALISIE